MPFADRIKIVRESLGKNQKEMAISLEASLSAIQSYESGRQLPGGKVLDTLARMGFNVNWLLTGEGEMRLGETAAPYKVAEQSPGYQDDRELIVDPIKAAFLSDWCSLSDIGKMRVWTLLKEEIQKEKER